MTTPRLAYADDLTRALREGAPPRELARIIRGVEPVRDPLVFKSFSGLLKRLPTPAEEDGTARPLVWATHSSSNTKDLHGTWWDTSSLQRMLEDFRGLTGFMNHRYDVPEDVFGTMTDGRLVSRVEPNGTHHIDLDMCTAVETENPRAVKTHRMIGNGTKLGQSVGVMLLNWEWQDPDGRSLGDVEDGYFGPEPHERADARLTITDCAGVESSVVGIPSNRRGWQHAAEQALARAGVFEQERPRQYGGSSLERTRNVDETAEATQPAADAAPRGDTAGAADHAGAGSAAGAAATRAEAPDTAAAADDGPDHPLVNGFSVGDLAALDAALNAAAGVSAVAAPDEARKKFKPKRLPGGKKYKPNPIPGKKYLPDPLDDTDVADPDQVSDQASATPDKAAAKALKKADKKARKANALVMGAAAVEPVAVLPARAAAAPVASNPVVAAVAEKVAMLNRTIQIQAKQQAKAQKMLKKAAKIIAKADDTGLYRPTRRDALANLEMTPNALIELSDDDAYRAMAKGILA